MKISRRKPVVGKPKPLVVEKRLLRESPDGKLAAVLDLTCYGGVSFTGNQGVSFTLRITNLSQRLPDLVTTPRLEIVGYLHNLEEVFIWLNGEVKTRIGIFTFNEDSPSPETLEDLVRLLAFAIIKELK